MKCAFYHKLIGEHLEGTIRPADKARLESHLASCADCRGLYEDFQAIAENAKDLDREAPPDDVWPNVLARVQASRREERMRAAARRHRFAPGFGRTRWAWAATLLFAGAVIGLVVGLRPWKAAGPVVAAGSAEVQTMAKLEDAEKHYKLAIQSLTEALTSAKGSFDLRTAALLAWDLRAVDTVIESCRAAVAKEPGNIDARVFLLAAYQKKVDMLNDVLDLRKRISPPAKPGASL